MLVVVAIIALLISLLIPFLHDARERAITTVCIGNMRQTQMGIQLYGSTFQGVVPSFGYVYTANAGGSVIDPNFFPNAKAIRCPKNRQNWTDQHHVVWAVDPNPGNAYGQVWPNGNDPAFLNGQGTYHNCVVTFRIRDPSNYVMILDAVSVTGSGGYPSYPPAYNIITPSGGPAWCVDMLQPMPGPGGVNMGMIWSGNIPSVWLAHRDCANGGFADGHVETCSLHRLYHLTPVPVPGQCLQTALVGATVPSGPNQGSEYGGGFLHWNGIIGPLTAAEMQ
jgi:prepilin-type processing-associated H-X9-DG protein